jgi:ABC-2 type transport system ATP-binding protein
MTARETLEFTARFFYSGPAEAIQARIDETLELVGLADKADRPTKGFSGGERQRLGIAQAQVNYPDLLILDEPAAALDPVGRRDVLDVMERLRAYTTIFYSTHILDDVERVSDYVAILDHGRMVASSPTAAFSMVTPPRASSRSEATSRQSSVRSGLTRGEQHRYRLPEWLDRYDDQRHRRESGRIRASPVGDRQ